MIRRLLDLAIITLIACLALLASFGGADAQPASPPRVGVLLVGLSPESKEVQQFRQGLRDAGYSEGRNLVIEWRLANGDYGRVPELVADLVQSKIDAIVVDSTIAAQAAKRSTSTIPIVMALVVDPIRSGLVTSLAHPGGNVTGLSMMTTDLNAKRLQLLKEANPRVARVAVLWNPDHPFHSKVLEDLKVIAPSLSMELSFVGVRRPEQFRAAFSDVSRAHAQALYVVEDPFFFANRTTLLKLASKARLPTIHELRRFPDEGALMSYGPNLSDLMRRSVGYVDKVLKGAKPGDLPIEQPTKFELVVNLRTAKARGITISESILLLAPMR